MQNTVAQQSVLKHALLNQYNLISMGGMVLFSAASGSVVPVALAAVGEAAWLLGGAQSERFRRWVATQAQQRDEQRWRTQVETMAAGIDPNAAARLRLVGGALWEIARASGERGQPELVSAVHTRLAPLLQDYANLAASHQRLARLMGAGGTEAVEGEVVRLGRALAEEKDATVRISLRQAVALAQRRLKRFEQVESVGRDLAVKLSTFETSLEFVHALVGGGEPEDEILMALDEIQVSSRFDPEREKEAVRGLGERRMTSGMYAIVPPVDGR